jgi:ACS family hexuronate transporter-like MFS transporter
MPVSIVRGYRWRICALLFFATTLNYLDRQVLGILAPDLQRTLRWSEVDYGNIVAAFKLAYAIGLLGMGRFLDLVGVRRGYAAGLTAWSIAGAAHGLATGVGTFAIARGALGVAEAVNFPAAVKTIAEWFPRSERALAAGIFNSGTNVGAILAPLVVPWLAVRYGWQSAFVATGLIGLTWLFFWLTMYRAPALHPRVSAEELAHIQSDGVIEPAPPIPWRTLVKRRDVVTMCLMKFVTDPVWWFFLFWLPKFLNERHGVSVIALGLPMIVIYQVSSLGSIGGGWLSSHLIRRGMTLDRARKTTLFVAALCALPIAYASRTDSLWTAVALVALGTAAHQAFSANIYAIIGDVFPPRAVGSVVGLSSFSGALAGAIIAEVVGWMLQTTGSYVPVFGMFSVAYVIAWLILRWGIRDIAPVSI